MNNGIAEVNGLAPSNSTRHIPLQELGYKTEVSKLTMVGRTCG